MGKDSKEEDEEVDEVEDEGAPLDAISKSTDDAVPAADASASEA